MNELDRRTFWAQVLALQESKEDVIRSAAHVLALKDMELLQLRAIHLNNFQELKQACSNVGVDLDCGACAEVFYTGVTVHAHDCDP